MKKIASFFVAIIMTVGVMLTAPLTVNAASKSSLEGVDASLKADTSAENQEDGAKITLTAKNASIYDVYEVNVKIDLPSGLSLKSGKLSDKNIDLTAGKTYKSDFTVVKASVQSDNETSYEKTNSKDTTDANKEPSKTPKTGDDYNVGINLAILIVSGAVALFMLNKYYTISKKLISITLCIIISASVMPRNVYAAESDTQAKTLTVEQTITIDEQDYVVKATISFVAQTNKKSDPEKYYSDNGDVIRVIDAKQSDYTLTETEAINYFSKMGFSIYPVTYEYAMDGSYLGEIDAVDGSQVKHPMYQSLYFSTNKELWALYFINGEIFANPVSFNLESNLQAQLLISESKELTSYNYDVSKFFVTIPDESAAIVKTVDKIVPETLDELTVEVIKTL